MSEIFGVPVAPGAPLTAPITTVDAVVIAAMEEEIAPFEQRADRLAHQRHVGMARSVIATAGGRQILLVRSGIGAVNAATAAVLAVHAVRTPVVVSAGSAGGLGSGVRVGDVVIGDEFAFAGARSEERRVGRGGRWRLTEHS